MKRLLTAAILIVAASALALAQQPKTGTNDVKGVTQTLKTAGNFNTFLSLLEKAGLKNLGLISAGGKLDPTQAGPGGGPRHNTIFAPTDAAFAKMPAGTVESLKKDPERLRTFLLAHIVPGKVFVADVLTPVGNGTTNTFKELKSRQGHVLGFSCNGHTGMHQPRINNQARVGKFQDVLVSDYLIVLHEVDAVLM